MRFLIADADYPEFVQQLYAQNPSLKKRSYEEQMRFRNERLYGMADYYSTNLKKLGHEANDVWVNNEFLQRTWAKVNGLRPPKSWRWNFRLRRHVVPWVNRVPDKAWMFKILAAQIQQYKPDVLINMMMGFIPPNFLQEIQQHTRLIVSWGSPWVRTTSQDPAAYRGLNHLVVSPSKTMVEYWNSIGFKAELLRHAFEPRILSMIEQPADRSIPISFVGLLRGSYAGRRESLEYLCSKLPEEMFVWASSLEGLSPDSAIRERHQGSAWGEDLYKILSRSKMTWNNHHELAGDSADNVRMFEATGAGTLLVTDWKGDLGTLFDAGKEVVAYRNIEECAELMRYYLDHPKEREAIALAGQKRTLMDHTYWQRAQQLADMVKRHL